MYKCLNCGNEYKFYGLVKEQGNAVIYQNMMNLKEPEAPLIKDSSVLLKDSFIRKDRWAVVNIGVNDELTWAYPASQRSWKGFYKVKSCAACHSTNIIFISGTSGDYSRKST